MFTVVLDFGTGIFSGADRFLEIGVRTNGNGAFATLSPRQKLTPTPYAITAENLNGVVSGSGLSGPYGGAVTLNNSANQFNGAFSGNGANVTNVNALTLGGLSGSNFWKTAGNGGTAAGVNFLGTVDNQALELKVNNQEAMRFEPTTDTPNVVGGYIGNCVQPGLSGVTIGGGGTVLNGNQPNVVTNNGYYATIAGGYHNKVAGYGGVVLGGSVNFADGDFSGIGAGQFHTTLAGFSWIGGGKFNTIQSGAISATIGGGTFNTNGGAL